MPKKVLVADDDALFCKLLQFTMEQQQEDWSMQTVGTGAETIASMEQSQPDLLVLDLRMPGGDGFSVLAAHKERGYTCPVLVVTHLAGDEHKATCEQLGAKGYLRKLQVRMDDVIQAMRQQLVAA